MSSKTFSIAWVVILIPMSILGAFMIYTWPCELLEAPGKLSCGWTKAGGYGVLVSIWIGSVLGMFSVCHLDQEEKERDAKRFKG